MLAPLSYAPVAAAVFAVPQFAPQMRRLWATGDTAGVSWSWAALTCVNNAAWTAYFALARYWTALVPSVSVAVLAGLLAIMLTRQGRAGSRQAALISAWSALLVTSWVAGGGAGLGAVLTAGFIVQVAPPLWTAYRVARPTGVSAGTWLLIFAELACWLIFGVHESDPRLITLGAAGVIASTLMLARIRLSLRSRDETVIMPIFNNGGRHEGKQEAGDGSRGRCSVSGRAGSGSGEHQLVWAVSAGSRPRRRARDH